jgi:hypothetical protein
MAPTDQNHCGEALARTHRTLRVTPAVAAGVEAGGWELSELLAVAEARATQIQTREEGTS